MARRRIANRTVESLQSTGKEYVHWDGELTGAVSVPAARNHLSRFTGQWGRNTPLRRVTVGSVNKIEADKARTEARIILRQAELGYDHAAERSSARAELTLAQVCDVYLAEGCDTKMAIPLQLIGDGLNAI